MEVDVKLIMNDECEQCSDGLGFSYHDQIMENMMCAKDLGKDSCQGDSGVSARMCSWAWYRGDMGVPTRISRAFILVVHPPTIKSEK